MEIFDAVIIAVPSLNVYKAFMRCNARVEPQSPPLGICSKEDCSTMQRYNLCKEQEISFSHGTDEKVETLHGFGKIIEDLADEAKDEEITPESLLLAPRLTKVVFNDKKVITGFCRQ